MKSKNKEEVAFIKNENNNDNSDGAFTCSWEDTTESRSSSMTKMDHFISISTSKWAKMRFTRVQF